MSSHDMACIYDLKEVICGDCESEYARICELDDSEMSLNEEDTP